MGRYAMKHCITCA